MIDDLRVNVDQFKLKKFNLNPKHVVPAALMLSATLLLTGCGNNNYYDYATITSSSTNTSVEASVEDVIVDDFQEEIMLQNVAKKVTNVTENDEFVFEENEIADNLVRDLNNWNVNYTYSGLYQPGAFLQRYEQSVPFSNQHDEVLDDVTVDNLYSKVLENNSSYLQAKKESAGFCFYKELKNDEIRQICEYIVEAYNDFSSKKEANVDEVKCILNNLKIFQNSSASNAFVNDEYCLVTSPGMIDILGIMNDNSNVDVYKNTIVHEASHLFQLSCPDRVRETTKMIGISPQYDDEINPLNFSWYYEASAEKCTVNLMKTDPLVYQYMINYLESLSIATILDDNVEVSQNELNSFTKDLNSIFRMFNCTTEEEKIEIINMMYSIQIIQVEPEEFFDALGKEINEDEKAALKKDLRSSICSTLTKYFYKNLVEKTLNQKVSLQDLFYLISVFESDLNSHLSYNKIENYEYYEEFLTNYSEIQNEFFKAISINSGYSYEEILEKFNNYALYQDVDGVKKYNATLDWLTVDKQEYIMDAEGRLDTYSTANIQFVSEKRNISDERTK